MSSAMGINDNRNVKNPMQNGLFLEYQMRMDDIFDFESTLTSNSQ